jgi:predicted transposase YbfD/YdcC
MKNVRYHRGEITHSLANDGWSDDEIKESLQVVLDHHAHELAERIRNSDWLRDATDDHMSDCNMAADLIDPEVE